MDAVDENSMTAPYRTNGRALPTATEVPWICRWFGHTDGTLIPIPHTTPLRLIQKCGRRECRKWREVDLYLGYLRAEQRPWLELHEVMPKAPAEPECEKSE